MRTKAKLKLRSSFQLGSSMIELLVTMLISSIGFLGLASMQTMGLANTQSAYYRSQATILAGEYTEILRSNLSQVTANKFGDSADDGIDWTTSAPGFNATASCNTTTGCNEVKRAETDLIEWVGKLQSRLPSVVANVERVGSIYHLTISWADDRADTDGDGSNSKSFTTSFRP